MYTHILYFAGPTSGSRVCVFVWFYGSLWCFAIVWGVEIEMVKRSKCLAEWECNAMLLRTVYIFGGARWGSTCSVSHGTLSGTT